MKPEPPVTITPYRDGPYVVRGPFKIVDHFGNEIEVRRKSIALCRCGNSGNKPFCDGSHKLVGFRGDSVGDIPAAKTAVELP